MCHKSKFVIIWKLGISIYSICCSYYYMYLATFIYEAYTFSRLEIMFILDILLRFFIDEGEITSGNHMSHGSHKFSVTAKNYLFGQFITHVIPCVPFHYFKLPF